MGKDGESQGVVEGEDTVHGARGIVASHIIENDGELGVCRRRRMRGLGRRRSGLGRTMRMQQGINGGFDLSAACQ